MPAERAPQSMPFFSALDAVLNPAKNELITVTANENGAIKLSLISVYVSSTAQTKNAAAVKNNAGIRP